VFKGIIHLINKFDKIAKKITNDKHKNSNKRANVNTYFQGFLPVNNVLPWWERNCDETR
jgi:hypothetical protein